MSSSEKRWYNKLTFFYKTLNGILTDYLHSCIDFLSKNKYPLRSVSSGKLKYIPSRTKSFSKTFFPYCIDQRNKLNPETRMQNLYINFKNQL